MFVAATRSASLANLTACSLSANSVGPSGDGGAVAAQSVTAAPGGRARLLLVDCTLASNAVEVSGDDVGALDGVAVSNSSVRTTAGTAGRGGALFASRVVDVSVRGSTLEANTAPWGGAVFVEYFTSSCSAASFTGLTVQSNNASRGGGGAPLHRRPCPPSHIRHPRHPTLRGCCQPFSGASRS